MEEEQAVYPPSREARWERAKTLTLMVALAVALLVIVGLIWWNSSIVSKTEERYEAQLTEIRQQAESEKLALQRETSQQLSSARQQMDAALRQKETEAWMRFSIPFAWAVRREMVGKENLAQIEQYFDQLIHMGGMQRIVLARNDGTIVVSTDKKYEGTSVSEVAPKEALEANDAAITEMGPDSAVLTIPIVGLNTRLGTVVIDYRPTTGAGSTQ